MELMDGGVNRNPNRRELLRGGAGLAVAAGLAGCGVGNIERGSLAETEKPIKKRVDGDLVYFNYAEYIHPELVKGSRSATA
jgi:spermidine/putrescine transport system substrate-binding protein